MKQTKRSNSHLESPEYYNSVIEYLKDAKTFSDRKIPREFSNDLKVSLEEAVKKLELSDSLKIIAKNHNKVYSSKISREILYITTEYSMQFSQISCQFEKWSAQRRLLIKKIENIQKSLNQMKTNCAKTRMVFSAMYVSSTLGSVICDYLNVSSPKLLFASGAFGCLSLVSKLIEMSQTKSSVEEALKELREDREGLRNLQILFQEMRYLDRSVRDLFPHGVDTEIVRMFQDSDERSPETSRGIHELIKAFPTSKLSNMIWLSIILTNAMKDTSILKDEDFLAKAQVFSKSPVAEMWWKGRMKSKEFPSTSKFALEADLMSCLKVEFQPSHAFPLLSTVFWESGLHTIGSVFVNALVVFHSYSEINGNQKTREVDALRQLKKILQKEYEDVMKLYEKLSPHYD